MLASLRPSLSQAHVLPGGGGFVSGLEHPLFGPDHLLAMLAVGLWGAQMGGRRIWSLPVSFPLVMTFGAILGMAGLALPHVEAGIAISVLALGLAIALAWRPGEPVALAFVAVFAILHGHAHGLELPDAADPASYAAGFVISTGLIHLAGVGLGVAVGRLLQGGVSRALGLTIAAGGLYFVWA